MGEGRPDVRTGLALRDPIPWHDLVLTTETAEQTDYELLMVPEIAGREAFATLAGLARATYRIGLGAGVVPLDTRSLEVIAMGAASVHEQSRGRMTLGIGAGAAGPGSLDRLRESAGWLRDALARRPVTLSDGEVFALSLDPGPEPLPIWIAALGEKTMRLAGEVADGVLLNWCTPERVSQAKELVREGAEASGRDPADVTMGVYVRACVGQEDDVALPALKAAAAEYAAQPHYRRQFEASGLGREAEAAAAAGTDLAKVPDTLVRSVCLLGDSTDATARLAAYRAAGADLPIVYPVASLEAVSSIQATVLALAPSPKLDFEGPAISPRWAVDYDLHGEHGE